MNAGWHLWNVTLSGHESRLWITTAKRDIDMAVKKAQTFIRNSSDFRECQIKVMAYHGTLDA